MIRLDAKIQWNISQSREGRWIGRCDPLNLSMEGTSLDELRLNIDDAVQLLLMDLLESGDLDTFLERRGWRRHGGPGRPGEAPVFDVPIELLVQARTSGSARVLPQ